MKIFLVLLVEILLALVFMLFISSNYDGVLEYTCPFNKQHYEVSYAYFASIIYLVGGLTTIFMYAIFNLSEAKTISAYKKAHEKNEIAHAEKDSKILSLENKVKTLETALDNVLKSNKNESDEQQ